MIRGRKKKHLQNLRDKFPSIQGEIVASKDTDYRYRVIVPKPEWVLILSELAKEQSWSNFKSKAHANSAQCGNDYVNSLHEVWETMHNLQVNER